MLTVYFDSSFYQWLSRATDEVAEEVIQQLNQLGVRGVLSDVHRAELGRWAGPDEVNQRLYERLIRLRNKFLVIEPASSWEFLLLPKAGRALLSQVEGLFRAFSTLGHSWAHLARNSGSKAAAHALNTGYSAVGAAEDLAEQLSAIFESQGLPTLPADLMEPFRALSEPLGRGDPTLLIRLLGMQVDMFGDELSPELASGIQFLSKVIQEGTQPANPAEAEAFLAECRLHFGSLWDEKEKRDRLHDVVATSGEVAEVAMGLADEKAVDSLARSLQDGDHFAVFVNHSEEIDLFQPDKGRFNQVKQMGSRHPIVEWDLQGRVFRCSDLQSVPKAVSQAARLAFGDFWMISPPKPPRIRLSVEEGEGVVRDFNFDVADMLPPAVPVVFVDLDPPEGEPAFVGLAYCPSPSVGAEVSQGARLYRVEHVTLRLGSEVTWVLVELVRLDALPAERLQLMESIGARLAPQPRRAKATEVL